jgi:hypothetical protein
MDGQALWEERQKLAEPTYKNDVKYLRAAALEFWERDKKRQAKTSEFTLGRLRKSNHSPTRKRSGRTIFLAKGQWALKRGVSHLSGRTFWSFLNQIRPAQHRRTWQQQRMQHKLCTRTNQHP